MSRKKRQQLAPDQIVNTISEGTVIAGNIITDGDIRIEGKVTGTLVCKAKLVIGPKGMIEGNVDARFAHISGAVKGHVLVRELLHLEQTSHISGDIVTLKLSVDVGATFSGNCRMGDAARGALQEKQKTAEELAQAAQKIRSPFNPVREGQPL